MTKVEFINIISGNKEESLDQCIGDKYSKLMNLYDCIKGFSDDFVGVNEGYIEDGLLCVPLIFHTKKSLNGNMEHVQLFETEIPNVKRGEQPYIICKL